MQHKMKAKLKARPKRVNVEDMIDHFEEKGIKVNKESLRSRSKTRRTLGDLEDAADRRVDRALNDSDDEDDIVEDAGMAEKEQKTRGRKRKRERSVDSDEYMNSDDDNSGKAKSS